LSGQFARVEQLGKPVDLCLVQETEALDAILQDVDLVGVGVGLQTGRLEVRPEGVLDVFNRVLEVQNIGPRFA